MTLDSRERLLDALEAAQWIISEAAKALGCSRQTVYKAMRRHAIPREPIAPELARQIKSRAGIESARLRYGGAA